MIWAISGGASRQFTATLTASSFASAEGDLEELGTVLVDERDAVLGADAGRPSACATWFDRRSSSPKVIGRPSNSIAGVVWALPAVRPDDARE